VTAKPATVPMSQNAVEIEIAAAAAAPAGEKTGLTVVGTSADKTQVASPAFKLEVVKK
jgi:hypothetical protein